MKSKLTLIATILILYGCGGSDDDSSFFSQNAQVTDVRVDPETARIGEEIVVRVDFNPSQEDSITGIGTSGSLRDTTVVVRIPPGVDYVAGSSEFDGSDVHGFRERGPNTVEICNDGTRALTYEFADGELTDNENKIRLSAVAYEGSGRLFFEARADHEIDFPCNVDGEDSEVIVINP